MYNSLYLGASDALVPFYPDLGELSEGQNVVRETVDRLRQSQEENEMLTRRREELEARVASLEAEYEELLGSSTTLYFQQVLTALQRRRSTTKRPATLTSPSRSPT